MQPQFYKPNPFLAGIVSHIMIFEVRFDAENVFASPFPPTPQNSIHFYPRDAMRSKTAANGKFVVQPESVIIGPQVTKVNIQMGLHHLIVSVAFNPGGLFRLLKIPLYELYDQSFDATLLLGSAMQEVNDRLQETNDYLEMKNIVEAFLMRKIVASPLSAVELAVKKIINHNGALSMEAAASFSCLGLRQFERKSKEMLGYSPKFFSRLIRFSTAYRLKENRQDLSWTTIANIAGYFDQMHLIRDFKEFTGVAPGLIAKEINDAPFRLQEKMKF
ncbi:MAG: AraC family transcriptional regulator [Sphingobacteriaceae bacterium]|nr:MAG: AraC family transcriptional regulator [Sphingobacteriaceae bacterium]